MWNTRVEGNAYYTMRKGRNNLDIYIYIYNLKPKACFLASLSFSTITCISYNVAISLQYAIFSLIVVAKRTGFHLTS